MTDNTREPVDTKAPMSEFVVELVRQLELQRPDPDYQWEIMRLSDNRVLIVVRSRIIVIPRWVELAVIGTKSPAIVAEREVRCAYRELVSRTQTVGTGY